MNGSRMNRWAIGLALLVGAIAVGAVGYQFGVSHGLEISGQVAAAPPGTYPPYWWRPWGFGFFPIFPLLFIVFWIFVVRALVWGGPWRSRWYDGGPHGVPSRFEEWHRRAHEQMNKGG